MTKIDNQLLCELQQRNIIFQCTNLELLNNYMNNGKITLYLGFDITAPSLHCGHLLWMKLLKRFQAHGHRILCLFGDMTTRIGDPTGKKKERLILPLKTIEDNKKQLQVEIRHLLGENIEFLENSQWLESLNYGEVLRDYGSYLSLAPMLSRDVVRDRLDNQLPISFLEFNYPIMQGIDFTTLFKEKNCLLQLGGSDQWANIITGVDLIKKKYNKEVVGLTYPLLVNSNGIKMGKTESGALWLNQNLCTPYELWQFFRNISDDILKNIAYGLLDDNVEQINQDIKNDINNLKIKLSNEIVTWVHGASSIKIINDINNKKIIDNPLLIPKSIKYNLEQIPISISELLILVGFVKSKSEARTYIEGGAVKINNIKVFSISEMILTSHFQNTILTIEFGKKKMKYIIYNNNDNS